jgi:hypothetical protein
VIADRLLAHAEDAGLLHEAHNASRHPSRLHPFEPNECARNTPPDRQMPDAPSNG